MAARRMTGRDKSVEDIVILRRRASKEVLLFSQADGGEVRERLQAYRCAAELLLGSTLEEAVAKSLQTAGLEVSLPELRWIGVLTSTYDSVPEADEANLFELDSWAGELSGIDGLAPLWVAEDAVPSGSLCSREQQWLTQHLAGRLTLPVCGHFRYGEREAKGAGSSTVLESCISSFTSLPPASASGAAPPLGNALVVSTVSFRRAPASCATPLESFIRYHLRKGFALIMLFVDDAGDEAALSAARRFPASRVIIRVRGEALLEEQRAKCSSFERFAPLMGSDVSARQVLDAELAMAEAPALGCAWVVCLDSDELFYTEAPTVVPHFERLAADDVDQMTYLNHEGVPEVPDVGDYFAEVTLFRRHHFSVPLSGPARDGLRFWMDRSKRGQYMLFYDNGKSACRTGLQARPRSQHLWELPEGRRSCTALADPRRMDVEGYRDCADPCILHFPICGSAWFLAKYQTLGNFADTWLGSVPLPKCFHTDARDLCAEGEEALRSKFSEEVLLDDPEEVQRQLSCGSCLRIEGHARLLDARETQVEAVPRSKPASAPKVASALPLDAGFQGIERGWVLSKALGYL